ncbi:MAG: GNAT family N-acetyltransferase [Caulobacterales bacterium]|nr:GNAT family N-acetyltransferase [Caulobacterales bacterium]MCA0371856.1 GNAT family N-acetyltransferase [Pseudomonadota bacterium]
MIVTPLNNSNYNQWLPLWNGYLEFYKSSLAPEVTDIVFNRLCDPAEKNMGGFLAFDGDIAIGLVHYIVHRGTWSVNDVCYLEDLFVGPNVRGGGVGRALINAVADFARESDLRHVYWQTQKTNERAQILYEKMAGPSEFIVYKMSL